MRVELVKTIENSIDNVWTALSDFGNWHRFDSTIKTLSAEGEGVGATRSIEIESGASAFELCVVCDPKTFTLAYTFLPPAVVPLKNYVSTVSCSWAGPGRTEVRWLQVSEWVEDERFPVTEEQYTELAYEVYGRTIDGLAHVGA